jgi:L-iditol 2-dehydrogenase
MMKAALLKVPGNLVIEEVETPSCPERGLKVKIKACSICSTDVKMFQKGHRALAYPRILGHEISGVVVENLASFNGFKIGDRVQIYPGICCGSCPACKRGAENQCQEISIIGFTHDGGFAEFLTVPLKSVTHGGVNLIPDGLSFEEATLAEPLASCINGQKQVGLRSDDIVLIVGAGPIGLLHAMLAQVNGALKVLVAEQWPSRLKAPKMVPIDRMIDISRESLKAVVQKETNGRGVDAIIIASSEADISTLPELLSPGGRICLFSGIASGAHLNLDANLAHYRELSLVGAYGSTAAQNSEALNLIASGKVQAGLLITKRIPLDHIEEGMDYVSQRKGLKAVVTFD